MRISFLLPNFSHVPIGGYKVVYEYANRLQSRGHQVYVIQAPRVRTDTSVLAQIQAWKSYGRRLGSGPRSFRPAWASLHPEVRLLWRPSFASRWIPDADVVIATAWQTAEWVARYPASKGAPCYFIQHVETWSGGNPERVIATWRLPLHKIVIARWLQDYAISLGETAAYVPNGRDPSEFGVDRPPALRNPKHVGMMVHPAPWKGTQDGLKALNLVHEAENGVTVTLFGAEPRPQAVPAWARYVYNPDRVKLRQLYNELAVFLGPSWAEGWGLPPMEAALSGAALAVTDIGGHREYAEHLKTALLSPVGDSQALAHNVLRLIRDDTLRLAIAERAVTECQKFDWGASASLLEKELILARQRHVLSHPKAP